jgi:hypothetical protein
LRGSIGFASLTGEAASAVLVLVELADRPLCALLVAHLNEGKPAGLTRGAIANDVDRGHRAGALEQGLEVRLGGLVRQVTDV